ncbi:MAG: isoaspartyl peptidase/L-asparaginase [Nitrospirae bacterium]|nr:isoaspartyl peptidase/L-asparaginase [Nitrospirota bacterium]
MILIAHGGAGDRKPTGKALKKLSEALSSGYDLLKSGGTACDAVVNVITVLEDSGIFNAGRGGNLQLDGIRRLDASIMEGKDLRAGSVIGLEHLKNPIKAALMITGTPHVILTNKGAGRIAKGLGPLPKPDRKAIEKLERAKKKSRETVRLYEQHFSTVGAVALDETGDLAAGASTGGVSVMLPGRVGDTPVIGAGIYADNSLGAASCTGMGEAIIRIVLAKEICMQLATMTPARSARLSLNRILNIGGKAGVILINNKGQFSVSHNTKYMASGFIKGKKLLVKEAFQ